MRHRDKFDTAISEVAKHVRKAAAKAAEDYEPIASVDLFAEVTKIGGGVLAITEMENNNDDADSSKKDDWSMQANHEPYKNHLTHKTSLISTRFFLQLTDNVFTEFETCSSSHKCYWKPLTVKSTK